MKNLLFILLLCGTLPLAGMSNNDNSNAPTVAKPIDPNEAICIHGVVPQTKPSDPPTQLAVISPNDDLSLLSMTDFTISTMCYQRRANSIQLYNPKELAAYFEAKKKAKPGEKIPLPQPVYDLPIQNGKYEYLLILERTKTNINEWVPRLIPDGAGDIPGNSRLMENLTDAIVRGRIVDYSSGKPNPLTTFKVAPDGETLVALTEGTGANGLRNFWIEANKNGEEQELQNGRWNFTAQERYIIVTYTMPGFKRISVLSYLDPVPELPQPKGKTKDHLP